ncbi:hypothetical protein WT01_02945 [Burkholderia cepacia]|nr:hypothetical protein WS88_10605 [Burkholderia cepacia]KVL44716.1 hypothetical protein WT01_02945 [Burkholderia cepacia]
MKSSERFEVFRGSAFNEERAVLRAADPVLDALLRYQRSGDLLEAQKVVDANKERLKDVRRYPMFCLASAYLMPLWKENDVKTASSFPWLDALGDVLPQLPDVAIIKAALYMRRRWSELGRDEPLTNREWRHNEAAKLAVESMGRGVPAYRFGFLLLSEVLDIVAQAGALSDERSRVCQRAGDVVAWLSRRVDPAQSCTSIELW